jgi:hypothetical protein
MSSSVDSGYNNILGAYVNSTRVQGDATWVRVGGKSVYNIVLEFEKSGSNGVMNATVNGEVLDPLTFTGNLDSMRVFYSYSPQAQSPAEVVKISNFKVTGTSAAVPEPSTVMLLGSGLVGLFGFMRKR